MYDLVLSNISREDP